MQQSLPDSAVVAIRGALLAFFDASARPLPWRKTRDPYAVWVSEVMSQQTRVETVIPYYDRWLSRFPDVAALAGAAEDDVLKAWEGLGYYSRARNLHAAARLVRERYGGALPDSYDALRTLPGVGDYTAGAVSSIAFGGRHPAVDGNVRRVLSRLLDHPAPPAALLRNVAGALVPAERPGDFNQALMELGATFCTPRAPRCSRCPVMHHCAARAAGTQEERPQPKAGKPIPTFDMATAIVRTTDARLLVVRRPRGGLLGGMWCFPAVEVRPGDDPARSALDLARTYADIAGFVRPPSRGRDAAGNSRVPADPLRSCSIGIIEHVFSHRRERYHCFAFDAMAVRPYGDDIAWIEESDTRRPLPRAQQKIRSLALAYSDVRQARKPMVGGADPA